MSVTQRREWGVLVERAVADVLDVEHVPDEADQYAYDLQAREDTLVALEDVDGSIGVLQDGDVGEVKSAAREVCRESSARAGRVHITRENHVELVESGGFYVVAVYDPDEADVAMDVNAVDNALEEIVVVPAETVDALVESWRTSTHGYEYTQLAWTSIVREVEESTPEVPPSLKSPRTDSEDEPAATRDKSSPVGTPTRPKVGPSWGSNP